jgi:hypothetical protein
MQSLHGRLVQDFNWDFLRDDCFTFSWSATSGYATTTFVVISAKWRRIPRPFFGCVLRLDA